MLVPGEEDKDLSGFLYREGAHSIIGINKTHVPVRQRFTIAHEIGTCCCMSTIKSTLTADSACG